MHPLPKSLRHLLVASSLPALAAVAHAADAPPPNPLLVESTLPLHYPRFDQIHDSDFAPAFEQAIAEHRKEIAAIAGNPDAPTFDNTIVALERSGRTLERVNHIFSNLTSANTNPALQVVQRAMAPKLAAHEDEIRLDPRLFARIDKLYDKRDTLGLDAESARLLWRYHQDFVRAGAKLPEASKASLRALNGQIASLMITFEQNTLKERGASAVTFDTRAELAGLADAQIESAADAAAKAGKPGKFVIELVNTTGQPVLSQLTSHESRMKVMAASLARGSRGGEFDNRATVAALARLRAERAALLGYPDHAAFQLAEQTVGTVDTMNKLLAQLSAPAVINAHKEAAQLQQMIDADHGGFQLQAADWDFYTDRLRKARYAYDESQLKPYYELDHVLFDGVFYAANKLYGLTFKERHDLPVYDPGVRVFDVFDKDGTQLAIFIGDYYARANKQGGAWMNEYVPQNGLTGDKPVAANHLNIPKPPAGEPTLLTQDEVTTAFHEFGHALHGMLSHVKYPRFASPGVPRDFVEYPSQFNEMWATYPEVLKHFARHWKTGEPIPQALVDKVQAASLFNQGFATTEYLSATLLDQAWHQLPADKVPAAADVTTFEAAALHRAGLDFAPVPPRYRSTYFSHVFANGYSAGYYSYIWSEVLAADSTDWVLAHGGLTREVGDHIRATLLSRGGSVDAMTEFRDLTGGAPDVGPLLKKRGLTATE
ncbi:MAG TPA: M3 family metallopeptidase [Burkholderiaceae bacterium]